jgi:hypothetical protein
LARRPASDNVNDMKRAAATTFSVQAIWDDEAGVFYSQSDLAGLHVEAKTFDAFVQLVHDLAPEVVADNRPDIRGPFAIDISARRAIQLTAA